MNGLLSEPDRWRLWFGLLAVEPPVQSDPNNYDTNRITQLSKEEEQENSRTDIYKSRTE
jgi:hypothetical protein